jgi:biotin carboxyl carrier protein
VPDAGRQREASTTDRSDAARRADHAGIARLTEDLLPALLAKLGSTNLGELEVREGDWHVRLRRPFGVGPGEGRRATDRPSRAQPGHEGHGHGRAAPEGRTSRGSGSSSGSTGGGSGTGSTGGASGATAGTGAASASTNGTGPTRTGSGAGSVSTSGADGADRSRTIATSPAVGIFQPGSRATSGTKVRAGDSLGTVNVIGVPQDVLAPADGIVGSTLVESGTAVEYGQELIRIELATPTEAR